MGLHYSGNVENDVRQLIFGRCLSDLGQYEICQIEE